MRIRIDSNGLRALSAELRELASNGPTRVLHALDGALERTAEVSRDLAHVSDDHRHTGDLKASQSVQSDHGAGGWSGFISYGDPGAHWELERGGEHGEFIESLAHLSAEEFQRALDQMFNT
ncbi:hypothetical protein [Microlunatus flavus]|uniref:Uncharacterized protein n=1 Tax=Microlunatus flavus TaxID=1036181 RepID=A0A1H9LLK0_9ACTN|nr:hypothetical protein [Microlunatus flavus]SER12077.1 hypothetical protein SAMN05421756_1094 [Microlunatus flavus]